MSAGTLAAMIAVKQKYLEMLKKYLEMLKEALKTGKDAKTDAQYAAYDTLRKAILSEADKKNYEKATL